MYCHVHAGIVFEAYSPLGNPGRPSKTDTEPVVMDNAVIKEVAVKHNATPAQVWYSPAESFKAYIMHFLRQICIAFALHRGLVVIPKTTNPNRVLQNMEATKLSLSEEDMTALMGVDKNFRLYKV